MLTVRWLTGELEEFPAPVSVSQLSFTLCSRLGRNQIIHLFRHSSSDEENQENDDTTLTGDTILQPSDEVAVLVTPECAMLPQENERVRTAIRQMFGNQDFLDFVDLLRQHRAVVAGGSVLGALCNFPINDLDVYVHASHARALIHELLTTQRFHIDGCNTHMGSAYDTSFFRKNRILLRVPMRRPAGRHTNHQLDIIVVDDAVPIKQVVTRFDLSFCQTWWDGTTVYSSDPAGVRDKEGYLQPSYRQALFRDLNLFLVRRIRKYKKRGFTVHLSEDPNATLSQLMSEVEEEDVEKENEDEEKKDATVKSFQELHLGRMDDLDNVPPDQLPRLEDWAIRFFLTQLFQKHLTQLRPNHSYGLQKVAFFFYAYPLCGQLSYARLVAQPCWSNKSFLEEMVERVIHCSSALENMPDVYRQAFARTFGRTVEELFECFERRVTIEEERRTSQQLREFQQDMMNGWM